MDDDGTLTPPEELRARRIRRALIVAAVALVVIGAAIYLLRTRIDHSIKSWHARRSARDAFTLIEQEKWAAADEKARNAYQLSQTEPEAWRAIARLLSRRGQPGSSLEWWAKVSQAGRLTDEDRRDYAGAALAAGQLSVATEQINHLLATGGALPLPIDMLLAAQLNSRRMDGQLALDFARRVMTDPRARPNEIISAALLVVAITRPDSPPYGQAWAKLEELARNPANPMSLDALVQMAQLRAPAAPATDKPFSELTAPPATKAQMSPEEIARALEAHPKTRPYDHLLALQLRARNEPWRAAEYVNRAIEQYRAGDDETLQALATWLNASGRPDAVLQILPLEKASRQRGLFLSYADALAALERWTELKDVVSGNNFPLEPMLQHMYLAVARSRLGETSGAANEWQRALEGGDSPHKLFALGGYAESHGNIEIADQAYARAIESAPDMRPAYAARLRIAEQRGETKKAQEIAAQMVKAWPNDAEARQEDFYLRLLLGGSSSEAAAAEKEADSSVTSGSADWNVRKLLGLARLRLGKNAEALQAFSGVRATGAEPPGALAVRAAALFANGWKDGAKNDARNLGGERLLPEERALLAPLLSE